MIGNIKVERGGSENNLSILRRFTKRMQGSGILRRVRGRRYHSRALSQSVQKKQALKKLGKREKYEELVKLGKIIPRVTGRRPRKK
ncbi:MAG: 30S ribosomal protein S21 [Candidatus Pacebacteria bacterium]|nr:30S ribosomal protein S21 [Candidatus Paceibacterota bacterium]